MGKLVKDSDFGPPQRQQTHQQQRFYRMESQDIGNMENFRVRYQHDMQVPVSSFYERFPILEAKNLKDNLDRGIYEEALAYLTGSGEDQRGLSLKTLDKFNVGLGTEKFTNGAGVYQGYDAVYFPMYAPRTPGG